MVLDYMNHLLRKVNRMLSGPAGKSKRTVKTEITQRKRTEGFYGCIYTSLNAKSFNQVNSKHHHDRLMWQENPPRPDRHLLCNLYRWVSYTLGRRPSVSSARDQCKLYQSCSQQEILFLGYCGKVRNKKLIHWWNSWRHRKARNITPST